MKKLFLLILALIMVACSGGGSDFERNQKTWRDAGITHYRFELSIGCFCPFRDKMPLTVEVRDGQIVAMAAADGTLVLDTDLNYSFFAPYSTVDQLFTKLDQALHGGADSVTVTYDPTYGFPAEIQIDPIKNAMDDELYLSATKFEPLQ